MQRGLPISIRGIHIGALTKQDLHFRHIALLGGWPQLPQLGIEPGGCVVRCIAARKRSFSLTSDLRVRSEGGTKPGLGHCTSGKPLVG